METKLQKWGNSDGIRIPSSYLKSLNLKTNDKVEINVENEKIVIYKVKASKISLKEEFEKYNGENLSKEFTWDEDKGNEIW
jgi:antitoxin MazE